MRSTAIANTVCPSAYSYEASALSWAPGGTVRPVSVAGCEPRISILRGTEPPNCRRVGHPRTWEYHGVPSAEGLGSVS